MNTTRGTKQRLENGTWLAIDADGTEWICKREPFNNGLGRWFVPLYDWRENLEDFMERRSK